MHPPAGRVLLNTVERFGVAVAATVGLIALAWDFHLAQTTTTYLGDGYESEERATLAFLVLVSAVFVGGAVLLRGAIVRRWPALGEVGRLLLSTVLVATALVVAMLTNLMAITSIDPMMARCNEPFVCAVDAPP